MKEPLLKLAYKLYKLKWWATRPVLLGVRLLLVQENRIVLVRHTYQNHWFFPGGAVNRGESMTQAAEREAIEEAGAKLLTPPKLLGIYTNFIDWKSDHIAVFTCDSFKLGKATDQWEIGECREFSLDALPPDMSPGSTRRLDDYVAGQGPYMKAW